MTTGNIKSVRSRDYGCMDSMADSILLQMQRELSGELEILHSELRALASERNGLARVEFEIQLREIS